MTVFEVTLRYKTGQKGTFIDLISIKPVDGQDPNDYIIHEEIDGETAYSEVVATLSKLKADEYPEGWGNNTLYDLTLAIYAQYRAQIIDSPGGTVYSHEAKWGFINKSLSMLKDVIKLRETHVFNLEIVTTAVCLCNLHFLFVLRNDEGGNPVKNALAYIYNPVEMTAKIVHNMAAGRNIEKNMLEGLEICIRSAYGPLYFRDNKKDSVSSIDPVTIEALFTSTVVCLCEKENIYKKLLQEVKPGDVSEVDYRLHYPIYNPKY